MSTDRIVLHSAIAEKFIAALKAALSSTKSSEPAPTLVTTASKARVQKIISNAVSSGAHFIHGAEQTSVEGTKEKDIRFAPVILGGAREEMDLWHDEAFAPLAACMIVKDNEEAVRVANRGGYGLSASVFTEDLRKGLALARRLESG